MDEQPEYPPAFDFDVTPDSLSDPDLHEALAIESYYQERCEDAAKDREHELGDATYIALAWDCLPDEVRRPYRTAALVTCEILARTL